MKINLNNTTNDIDTNKYNVAISDEELLYNQVYVKPSLFNVGIGDDYTNIQNCTNVVPLKKYYDKFFTKILLSNIPGNYDIVNSNIVNNNSYTIYYDSVEDNVTNISIELYDPEFRLIDISNQFSFTLEIHEIIDVLKETLINTKTNNVSSTGNFV